MNFFKKKYRSLKWRLIKRFGTTQQYADYLYFLKFGKKINWENPEDLNQWINWLAFNTDTTEWSRLSDKYAVRDYVKECGLEEILVPLLAVWNSPDDIDFSNLPEKFVIKANNGSGDVKIITEKVNEDVESIKAYFKKLFNHPFGIDSAEPHYLRIKPKIIAEQLLDTTKQSINSPSLIDYKIWCINGEPQIIWVALDRTPTSLKMTAFSPAWENCNYKLAYSGHYQSFEKDLPRPSQLNKMLDYARILSKGFPEARIDFYEVDNKVYFGEITFTSACGRMDYFTNDALKELGQEIKYNN